MPEKFSLFETHEGKPIRVGDQQITLISRVLRLQVPNSAIGFVWNRPSAVRVQTAGAGEVILPVADETRRYQVLLLALGLLGGIVLAALLRQR